MVRQYEIREDTGLETDFKEKPNPKQTMSQMQQNEKLSLLFFIATFSQFSTERDCLDPPSLFLLKQERVNICQE